ncbi:hypothetical protein [Yersinia intermedia]|uniref:hypothetical protein n=1 Tax=Yersinia intermedia TaxID=631 RepID=UPI0005E2310D|nr:hypothetical protein [Yersinia intermedia]CNI96182.1 Uncharacterised protein [Yersinia intermedia]
MNNIEKIIRRLKTRVALAELIGPDEMIVSASDLSALIAQLEAAQKERDDLKELNCHFDLSIRKTEGVNEVLRSKLEAAERALIKPLPIGELVHRLEGQTYEKWFSESDVKDLLERAQKAEAALSAANEKLTKPVVLPAGYSVRAGHPINEGERNVMIPKEGGRWLSRLDVEHAIRVAGFTVKEGATPIVIVPAPDGVIMRPQSENPLERCAAGRDGECHHKGCPQLRDNEPMATGRHCPIDNWDDE